MGPAATFAGTLLLLMFVSGVVDPMGRSELPAMWDGHWYMAMAEGRLGDCVRAPFCWRVGVPVVAGWLPTGTTAAFTLISWFGIAATAALSYAWVRFERAGSETAGAAAAALFLSSFWTVGFLVNYPWLTDAWGFAAIVAAVFAWRSGRPWAFAVTLLIGVLVRETTLVAVLLAYGLSARSPIDVDAIRRLVRWSVPAVVALVATRALLPAPAGWEATDAFAIVGERMAEASWADLGAMTYDTWGLLWLALAAVGAITNPRLAGRLLPTIVAAYAQLAMATDTQRLLVLAFPAMLLLGVEGLRWIEGRTAWPVLLLPVVAAAVGVTREGPPINPLFVEVWAAAAVLASAMVVRLLPAVSYGGSGASQVDSSA